MGLNAQSFLDTNILITAYDPTDPRKQTIARAIVHQGGWAISSQVLAEFASTLLHKKRFQASPEEVEISLERLRDLPFVTIDSDVVVRARDAHRQYGIHFYDGMIIAAAERGGCARIYSEDLNSGQKYFGIEVVNPFAL